MAGKGLWQINVYASEFLESAVGVPQDSQWHVNWDKYTNKEDVGYTKKDMCIVRTGYFQYIILLD